jgi:formylglycine-generating enzyme required for sulfatase activity
MNKCSHRRVRGVLALSVLLGCASGGALHAQPVPSYDFDFVTIGDTRGGAGNPAYDGPVGGTGYPGGRGSVGYEYRIGRLEVTTGQWLDFINTFAHLPQYEFFGDPSRWGAGVDGSFGGPGRRYVLSTVLPNAAMTPVQGLSWRECATYCNWLHNGKSSDPASLITGAYDTTTWGRDGTFVNPFTDGDTHLPGALFWIPTLDEWLKAGHYDPDRFGPGQPGYWEYSHSSDLPPVFGPPGIGQTQGGNYGDWRTPLASYPDVQSPWGLLDTTGGVREWTEEWTSLSNRNVRHIRGTAQGFPFSPDAGEHPDSIRVTSGDSPTGSGPDAGLRIASAVPSPSSFLVLLGGSAMFCGQRRRRETCEQQKVS